MRVDDFLVESESWTFSSTVVESESLTFPAAFVESKESKSRIP